MQIIFVDRRMTRARSLDVSRKFIVTSTAALTIGVLLMVAGLYVVTFRVGTEMRIPLVQDLVAYMMRDETARNEQFVRDNVSVMAKKLGEMQAQLMRLDALGERVSKIAGIRPEEFNFRELPGRGGAEPSSALSRNLTLADLKLEVARTSKGVESRADYMNIVESELLAARVRRALLPQDAPVSEGFVGSGFGMRTDPFTGQYTMHSGIDFAAPVGTPIFAAAGGVIASAELHPAYGMTIVIDHGKELSTLYAHASRLFCKAGDIVRRGQKIAEIGSTGRSTGPHLHFEVHVNNVPQNPWKYLAQQKPGSPLAPVVEEAAAAKAASSTTAPRAAAVLATAAASLPAARAASAATAPQAASSAGAHLPGDAAAASSVEQP